MVSEMPTIRLKKRKLSKKLFFPVSHTFSIRSSPSFSILFVKDLPILQKKKYIWFLVLFLISSAANSAFFYLIYINWYCFYFMTSHPTLHVMQFRENRRHLPVLSEALGVGVGWGGLLFQWKINFANIFWWFFFLKRDSPIVQVLLTTKDASCPLVHLTGLNIESLTQSCPRSSKPPFSSWSNEYSEPFVKILENGLFFIISLQFSVPCG